MGLRDTQERGGALVETLLSFFFLIYFLKFIFIFERDKNSMSRGGTEREGERESQAGSVPSAQSPIQGSVS